MSSLLTFRIARLQRKLSAQNAYFLDTMANITLVEWRVLWCIGSLQLNTMTDIADTIDIDKGQLSRRIKTMVTKGLLEVRDVEEDHRKQILNVTDEGSRIVERLAPLTKNRHAMLTEHIDPADLEVFNQVLDKLEAAAESRKIP